jgi:hypothetical protein
MKVYGATTTIEASPETIWAILTNAPSYPEWDPGIDRIEGRIAPGEKITAFTKLSPGRAFPVKVTEYVPGRKMVWMSKMPLGLFKGERTFTLTPHDNGLTEVSVREVFNGLLLPLIGRSIPDLTTSFEQFVTGLKNYAEQVCK